MPRGSRIALAAIVGVALIAAPALARKDAAPAGLPLPTGITLLDSRNGTSKTSYVWTATYRTSRPARDMQRYHAALKRLGACADPGCFAPKGRFTVVVGIPGG